MNFEEFFKKWNLLDNENIEARDIAGLLGVMDYLYCTLTKEQMIAFATDFYDNADDIYNSLNEAANKAIQHLQDLANQQKNERDQQLTEKENKNIAKA